MSVYLDKRRADTASRLDDLRRRLGAAAAIAKDRACVYVTGSFGRGEASLHSDLDLFIAGRTLAPLAGQDERRRALSHLDEICVKADLIEATREMRIQEFSGDGEYLVHYTVDQLIKALGTAHDDASNTFTARLLLLLESKPLIGEDVYREAVDQVIVPYWRDFEDHKNAFVPAFLANDILRIWRTFCVNYEARTSTEPKEKKAKRKLKNYKLKHSRLLTCYSALAYLLAVYADRKTVAPADIREMVILSPTERLSALVVDFGGDKDLMDELLGAHELFLQNTDASEEDLVNRFMDSAVSQKYHEEATEFGDLVRRLLEVTGKGTRLHQLLLV